MLLKSPLLQQISLSRKYDVWHEMDNLKGQPERLSDLLHQPQFAGIYLKHTSLTKAKYWIKKFRLMGLWQTNSQLFYTTQKPHNMRTIARYIAYGYH